jgi:hypothetical protein
MLHLFFGVDATEIWGICGVCRKMARMSHVVDKEIRKKLGSG